MLQMPRAGPRASMGKAQAQPTAATTGGTSWMVIVVRRKPNEVCTVSAVPTAWGGTLSVTSTENCALSATTKKPQRSATGARSQRERPKVSPTRRAQAPLAAMARVTSRSRPTRSATSPPQTHPTPPTAITEKASSDMIGDLVVSGTAVAPPGAVARAASAALAAMNAGIHVQYEYNSAMCPRYPPVASRQGRSLMTLATNPHEKGRGGNGYGPSRYPIQTNA